MRAIASGKIQTAMKIIFKKMKIKKKKNRIFCKIAEEKHNRGLHFIPKSSSLEHKNLTPVSLKKKKYVRNQFMFIVPKNNSIICSKVVVYSWFMVRKLQYFLIRVSHLNINTLI